MLLHTPLTVTLGYRLLVLYTRASRRTVPSSLPHIPGSPGTSANVLRLSSLVIASKNPLRRFRHGFLLTPVLPQGLKEPRNDDADERQQNEGDHPRHDYGNPQQNI